MREMFGPASQTVVRVPSVIASVTVHRALAQVVRRAEVAHLAPGRHVLRMLDLPLDYSSGTLRVRGEGVSVVRFDEITDVVVEAVADSAPIDEQERTLRSAMQRVSTQLSAVEGVAATIADFRSRVQTHGIGVQVDLEGMAALADARDATLARLDAMAADCLRELRGLQRQHSQVLAEQARSSGRLRVRRGLAVEVEVAAPGVGGQIWVDYTVPGARWAPQYELEVDGEDGVLALLAVVGQATGEDWLAAPLSLSTTDVKRQTKVPELPSWRIGRAQPPVRTGWRPLPSDLPALFSDVDRAGKRPPGPPSPVDDHAALLAELTELVAEFVDDGRGEGAARMTTFSAPEEDLAPPQPMVERASFVQPPPPSAPPPMPVGMPMPAPSGAPMPSRPPMMSMAAGGPPPAPAMDRGGAPSPKLRASRSRGAPGAGRREQDDGPVVVGVDPGDILDYGWLHLPHWSHRRRRGGLYPVTLESEVRDLARRQGASGNDAKELVEGIEALRALRRRLAQAELPPGCVSVDNSAFQHRRAPGPAVDLPSDAVFRVLAVERVPVKVKRAYQVVPRQDTTVLEMVSFSNVLAGPAPAGPLRVFEQGTVRATAAIEGVAEGGPIQLALGPEERIRVARNADVREETRGMLGGERAVVHTISVSLASRVPRRVEVEVFETLPRVAEDEAVTVSLGDCSARPDRDVGPDGRPHKGALRWRVPIEPGREVVLKWSYVLTMATRFEIVGGNRREP